MQKLKKASSFVLASQATPAPAGSSKVKLGLDLFSVRSQGWTPIQHLDFAARWGVEVVHFSEVRFLGGLEEENLRKVRAHAAELAIEVEIGMLSICPTSKMFNKSQGTAEEQLTRMIAAAKTVGSRLVRCVRGSSADRTGEVPLEAHIENTARVLRNVRILLDDVRGPARPDNFGPAEIDAPAFLQLGQSRERLGARKEHRVAEVAAGVRAREHR